MLEVAAPEQLPSAQASAREAAAWDMLFRHLRINHSKLFAAGKNHINGIEIF